MVMQVVSAGPSSDWLGALRNVGNKKWEWQIDEARGQLYQQREQSANVYCHTGRGRHKQHRTSCTGNMRGGIATVEETYPGQVKVRVVALNPVYPAPPVTFLDVTQGWGHTWIWEELNVM
jgi:hypothetical protein